MLEDIKTVAKYYTRLVTRTKESFAIANRNYSSVGLE